MRKNFSLWGDDWMQMRNSEILITVEPFKIFNLWKLLKRMLSTK